jgi:hypothetical protein
MRGGVCGRVSSQKAKPALKPTPCKSECQQQLNTHSIIEALLSCMRYFRSVSSPLRFKLATIVPGPALHGKSCKSNSTDRSNKIQRHGPYSLKGSAGLTRSGAVGAGLCLPSGSCSSASASSLQRQEAVEL